MNIFKTQHDLKHIYSKILFIKTFVQQKYYSRLNLTGILVKYILYDELLLCIAYIGWHMK